MVKVTETLRSHAAACLVAAAAGCLAGCAGTRASPATLADELAWESTCYDDIAHIASHLAGGRYRDCGLIENAASREAKRRFQHCLASATRGQDAILFGRASVLPDASRCVVGIRDAARQPWQVSYEFDYDAAASSNGEIAFRWTLEIARCHTMSLLPASAGYFAFDDCVVDHALTARMLEARQRPR